MIENLTTIDGCLAAIIRRDRAIGELEGIIRRLTAGGANVATRADAAPGSIDTQLTDLAHERDAAWDEIAAAGREAAQLRADLEGEREQHAAWISALADETIALAAERDALADRGDQLLALVALVAEIWAFRDELCEVRVAVERLARQSGPTPRAAAVAPQPEGALTAAQLNELADCAETAASDVAAYRSPRGTMTTWDDQRVGRMLAREPRFAELVPLVIAEIRELRRRVVLAAVAAPTVNTTAVAPRSQES